MAAPRDAAITIIGGGAIGCAVAYHLVRHGGCDVQVLERGELAAATTSQAAGLVGQVRASVERTRLAMASVALFSTFEETSGYPIDWRPTGSVRLAHTAQRAAELRDMALVAEAAGLEIELISPAEAAARGAVVDPTPFRLALWCPTDGYLQPHSLTTGYARAARDLGATFATDTTVTGISIGPHGVDGVRTDHGEVNTELVINAAGPWAALVARLVGVDLPIFPVRHEYFITAPVPGWHADAPVLRIPDLRIYVRAEGHGILCGGWEPMARSLDPHDLTPWVDIPLEPDYDVLSTFADDLATCCPGVTDAGIVEVMRGWPAFSPDGRFVVGPVAGVPGFVMAAACNAHGVSGSAGLAAHVAESLTDDPSPYVRSLSPDRFTSGTWDRNEARASAQRVYEDYYAGIGSAAQGGRPT
jgi:glycine/D-amino acid oxidase-like deaminating enzyme